MEINRDYTHDTGFLSFIGGWSEVIPKDALEDSSCLVAKCLPTRAIQGLPLGPFVRSECRLIDAMQSRADEAKRAEQRSQISVVVSSYIDDAKNGDEASPVKAELLDSTEPTPALPSSATDTGSESCAIVPLSRPRPMGSIVRYRQGFRD